MMALLALALLGAGGYLAKDAVLDLINQSPVEGRLVETGFEFEYHADNRPQFYSYEAGGFFHVTKNGVTYQKTGSSPMMSVMFNMITPVAKGEGAYLGVADFRGNQLYVFSKDKELYSKTMDYPIMNFAVNPKGYASVIIKRADETYGVVTYDGEGNLLSEGILSAPNSVPVCVDISPDGRILALSALDYGEMSVKSVLTFIYLKAADSVELTDGIFGVHTQEGNEIVGAINFMDNNLLLMATDSQIKCIDVEGGVSVKWSLPFENRLAQFVTMGGKAFAVSFGKPLLNADGVSQGQIQMYNMELERIGSFDPVNNQKQTQLSYSFNTLLVAYGQDIYGLNTKGDMLWSHVASQVVYSSALIENGDRVVLVGDRRASVMNAVK